MSFKAEVFDAQPCALLVIDRRRRIVVYNAAAEHLLGRRSPLTDAREGAACELVGCDHRSGQNGGTCVLDSAFASEGAGQKIRIDLPLSGSAPGARLMASAMNGRRDHVLIEVRPADQADRPGLSEASRGSGPRLRIVTLGLTRVETTAGPIDGPWLRQRPGVLLKYLASQRRPVSAEEIAEALWPDAGARALRGVRYYIHALRKRLEPVDRPTARSSFILHEAGRYCLSSSRVCVDVDEFEHHTAAGTRAAANEDVEAALDHLTRGLSLYQGDFLADEPYAEWAIAERDRLRSRAADALRVAATLLARSGDEGAALTHLERLADLEPFDVDVHRELIRLSMRRGRRTDALRRYQSFRRRMLSTFGEEVEFSLQDIRTDG
ncbi:MAG: hypothetical protein QOH46_4154 [Solirubrobacteraceae bacterium]|nr:hypothetical protein [Solirubrobacteraceae bacterium]